MTTENPNIQSWDTLWFNARVATMRDDGVPFGLLDDGAIAVHEGRICWIGSTAEISKAQYAACQQTLDCHAQLVTPGLIDCHTHLVYGGSRVSEFEMRLNGVDYAEIAKAGGGIISTVEATRESNEEALFESAKARLDSFIREGVTSIEVKSGYGLDLQNELKMLKVARHLGKSLPIDIITTFLGAHATPPEFQNDQNAYIDYICDKMLPAVAAADLADNVDAFCEKIAFTPEQVKRVFEVAKKYNLPIRLHAEQLSNQQGAVMAAEMGALSVDHIEFLAKEDVVKLKQHDTVAVLLPGAFYFLKETKLPPVEALRRHSVPMAVASDSNPGSSPVSSLLLMLNMACTLFGLTPEEALAGVTRNAAKALGISGDVGTLGIGKTANMVLWKLSNPAELSYRIGDNPCDKVMYRGALR